MAVSDVADDDGGRQKAHSLLQLAVNPISSLCCAIVAAQSTAHLGGNMSADAHHAALASSSSESSRHDERQHGRWAFQGLKGPWSRTRGSSLQGPFDASAPAASAKQSHSALAITGQMPPLH